ncbi:MAG: S-layer homology domain-containing protein [Cyanobacteria bacterium J06648_16]
MAQTVLHVNGVTGQDQQSGAASAPLKTITQALERAQTGTEVRVQAGSYDQGESFPLTVPAGVTLAAQGGAVVITGSGPLTTKEFGQQSVTLALQDRAQLRGITVKNRADQGSGVWIESGSPVLVGNRFVNCRRDGVFVSGNAMPVILENEFFENAASGLFMVRQAKGEVRQNTFRKTGYGIAISDQAAPLLLGNELSENRAGLVLSRSARPVLRKNRLVRNQATGLWVQDQAAPDLGHSHDPGENTLDRNSEWNLRNDTGQPVLTVGNQLNPNTVSGRVTYQASEIPDPVAVPPTLLGQVTPTPTPAPTPAPEVPTPPLDSRFADLSGHWAAPFVDPLAEAGLVRGFLDGSFRPERTVTRAEFAALVMAAFPGAIPTGGRTQPFADVPQNFWGREVIYRAQARGFVSGFPDGTFRPNAPMTRVQALLALVSGLDLGVGQSDQLGVYRDRAQIPTYATEAVAAATQQQIVVNYPDVDQLRPMQPITRAETAALVYQALVRQGKMPSVTSPYIVQPRQTSASDFPDTDNHWAGDYIAALASRNLVSGFSNGSFQPDAPMTRAQFASLIVGAFSPGTRRPATQFSDVPSDFWAAEVIQRAYRAEFLSGFPDYTFAPQNPVLKLQVLLSLVSGMELMSISPPDLDMLNRYSDRAQIPAYAKRAIATATQLGLIFNYPDKARLTPNRVASRAEVTAMVYQGMVILKKVPALSSPYWVRAGR